MHVARLYSRHCMEVSINDCHLLQHVYTDMYVWQLCDYQEHILAILGIIRSDYSHDIVL